MLVLEQSAHLMPIQDINISLYFVAWTNRVRATKAPGARQPRYLKLLQGVEFGRALFSGAEGCAPTSLSNHFFMRPPLPWLASSAGALLFVGLLLLLWVPLLVFSSGNPTYQVPAVVAFSVNASLLAGGGADTGTPPSGSSQRFPLFSAGDRRSQARWEWRPRRGGEGERCGGEAELPAALSSYAPEQLQLLCISPDADAFWRLTPPARAALRAALASAGPLELFFGWSVERDAPPPSDHGGPRCAGSASAPLADETKAALAALLEGGGSAPVPLLRNASAAAAGGGPGDPGGPRTGLYPLFWLLRGDACSGRPLELSDPGSGRLAGPHGGGGGGGSLDWAEQWVACNASLLAEEPRGVAAEAAAEAASAERQLLAGGGELALAAQQRHAPALPSDMAAGAAWWRLDCATVDAEGRPVPDAAAASADPRASSTSGGGGGGGEEAGSSCGGGFAGPRMVAVVERVQGGLIGQTLSKLGIAGLYSVFVYSIGR